MPKIAIAMHQIGDVIQQAVKPWRGVVLDSRLTEGKPEYLIRYADPETGDLDERWVEDGTTAEPTEAEIALGVQALKEAEAKQRAEVAEGAQRIAAERIERGLPPEGTEPAEG